jgi:sugar lactone lactonase YvrE
LHASKKFPETKNASTALGSSALHAGATFENVIEKKENLESHCSAPTPMSASLAEQHGPRFEMRPRPLAAFLIAVIQTLPVVALPEDVAAGESSSKPARLMDLVLRTREARLAGDNARWLEYGQQTLALAPDHPDLLISVARALAANGRMPEALHHLDDAITRGAGFDPVSFPEFKDAAAHETFATLRERALKNQAPVAPPETFVALSKPPLQPEGITYDPTSEHLFIGSLTGEVWKIDLRGKLTAFAGANAGLREVLGLKVDAKRRLLWFVDGVFPDLFPGDKPKKDVGISAVHAFHIGTRTRVKHCAIDDRPTLHGFNDLALARNGDVYVTDSTTSTICRLPGGECRLEVVVRDEAMSFPNGIVLTPDDSRLYVAHIEGISAVDLRTGKRTQLPVPRDGAVNSIDGLAWDGPDLLGIQGSPYLARTARIRLSDDGLAIREVVTMSSRPPAGLNQTTGVIVGKNFYTVAGFPDAAQTPAGELAVSQILRADLR